MWMTKLKSSAALVALTLLLAGSGLLAHQALAGKPPVVAQAPEGPTGPGTAPASQKTPRAAKLDLALDSFPKLHTLIRPHDDEWRHLQVEWLTDIVAARKSCRRGQADHCPVHGARGTTIPWGLLSAANWVAGRRLSQIMSNEVIALLNEKFVPYAPTWDAFEWL